MLAPVALFVYNRLWHTRQAIESLKANHLSAQSELFIFSDGPKNELDSVLVRELRCYLRSISGFKKIEIIEKNENFGLAKSIISGVGEMTDKFGRVIVLEDDLLLSPYFLQYMNEALDLYANEENVVSVHGYIYPVKNILPDTFFLRGADCWGWATWERGWKIFEEDGGKLFRELKNKKLNRRFDFNYGYPFLRMLENQIKGLNDSWAIRWYASAFLKGKLTLYPGRSLVKNIGFDNSGIHGTSMNLFNGEISDTPIKIEKIPIKENEKAFSAVERYFKSLSLRPFIFFIKFKQYLKSLSKSRCYAK